MNKELREQLAMQLREAKDRLVAQLADVTHEKSFTKDRIQTKWKDMGDKEEDNAIEVADFQDTISLERNLEISLEKIEKALKKMADGTYGTCERCGKLIEEARLLAYPEGAMCLACTAREKNFA